LNGINLDTHKPIFSGTRDWNRKSENRQKSEVDFKIDFEF